jgi:predicted type IV restriction endonuclease
VDLVRPTHHPKEQTVNPLELRYSLYKGLVDTIVSDGRSHVMMATPKPGKPLEIAVMVWDGTREEYRAYTVTVAEDTV